MAWRNQPRSNWLSEPEEHDYPAAQSYLNLFFEERIAGQYVQNLKSAGMTSFKAKDIFRASGLSLLGVTIVQEIAPGMNVSGDRSRSRSPRAAVKNGPKNRNQKGNRPRFWLGSDRRRRYERQGTIRPAVAGRGRAAA